MLKRNQRDLTASNAHFKKAVKRLPLGVASTFRYWGDERTIYVDHGKGGRTWDIDGNCYVDYRLGYGPAILGYADDRGRRGRAQGHGSRRRLRARRPSASYAVAERMAKMVPAAELVRFSNSGTEAVMAALRLARAYTGKDSYILIEGGYHGLFDAAMWMSNMDQWDPGSGLDPQIVPYSRGIPQRLKASRLSGADERREPARRHLQEAWRTYRRHADRADDGQLLRDHRRRPNSSSMRASFATNTACC